jgi:hypothetical protein
VRVARNNRCARSRRAWRLAMKFFVLYLWYLQSYVYRECPRSGPGLGVLNVYRGIFDAPWRGGGWRDA